MREQGLAVTWNNPDIQLYRNGVPVSSNQLEIDTDYQIVATIYNNSTEAPAVGMPVEFSYLDFGIGTTKIGIGATTVNLPVKGSPNHPVKAAIDWRTPHEAGHYCLQVNLDWDDDANPKNNLGQENTNVGTFSSPAVFEFSVRNDDTIIKRIQLIADCYTIPEKRDCKERKRKESTKEKYRKLKSLKNVIPSSEEDADWMYALNKHNPENFLIPSDWDVNIEPSHLSLNANHEQMVKVTITPPEGFKGEKSFNINGFYGKELIGGVTLIAKSK